MKIFYTLNHPKYFLSHRINLAKEAQKKGYEIHVIGPPGEGVYDIESFGIIYHQINLDRKSFNILKNLRTFFEILAIYRKLKPDIVHQMTIKPIIFGSIAAKIAGVPFVVNSINGLGYLFSRHGLGKTFLKSIALIFYRFSFMIKNDITIFQNSDDCRYFLRKKIVTQKNSIVIRGSGVDPNIFCYKNPPKGVPVILLASRMIRNKGIETFVDASRKLKEEGFHIKFVLVGQTDVGNPDAIAESTIKNWADEGYVEWLGFQSDMPKIFALSNIVCLPSFYREGIPKSLIEAASCGRPIITTDMPGCNEIVISGYNGFLIKPESTSDLVDAIKKCIDNFTQLNELGLNGRKLVISYFSLDMVIKQTLDVYKKLVSRGVLSK